MWSGCQPVFSFVLGFVVCPQCCSLVLLLVVVCWLFFFDCCCCCCCRCRCHCFYCCLSSVLPIIGFLVLSLSESLLLSLSFLLLLSLVVGNVIATVIVICHCHCLIIFIVGFVVPCETNINVVGERNTNATNHRQQRLLKQTTKVGSETNTETTTLGFILCFNNHWLFVACCLWFGVIYGVWFVVCFNNHWLFGL